MRKLVASELVSVDGVVQSSEEWQLPYFNDEMGRKLGPRWRRRTPCCSEG
jgi:hypothetical protein